MSKDLRTFLNKVKESGPRYYVEACRELNPELEVQVIQQKLAKEGHCPVFYCPRIKGSKLPLVSHLCTSYEMMGLAFEMNPKEILNDKNRAFFEYRKRSFDKKPIKHIPVSSAPVKEVVLTGEKIDLGLLPITKQAPLNSGKYISGGQLICKDPTSGVLNSGMYRHEVRGKNKLAFKPTPASHAGYITRSYADAGKPMEVAIFIGHHPATCLGSVWNGNIDVSELEIMGGYLGEPLKVTSGETLSLPVPAHAEIVIEGIIDATKTSHDGPYAEWTGYYGEQHECYIIDVTAITMRHDAIYQDLDPAQWEHNFLCTIGTQSNAYDAVRAVVPSVKSVYLPSSGGGLIICYVSIKKRIPGEAKRAGWAAVNSYQSTHIAIVVDDDIDVYNEEEILWALATRCTFDTDIDISRGITGGKLVPTSYDETRLKSGSLASKMVIDATMPVDKPFATRITPPKDLWEKIQLKDYIAGY